MILTAHTYAIRQVDMVKLTECTKREILSSCGLKGIDYQVDPYVGCEHYCYYCYALAKAETDWSEEIRVHQDIAGQLRDELANISPQKIYMGYQTDPYQPCEAECQQTRRVLELFLEKGCSASILTKSDLVVRDINLLKAMDDASVSVSVAFNDNQTRRYFEANTMDTERRVNALRQLKQAGVKTGALVCPVIPHITDAVQWVETLHPHADVIWVYGLSIDDPSGQSWINTRQILNNHFPDLIDRIEPILFDRNHAYWANLRQRLEELKKARRLNLNIYV